MSIYGDTLSFFPELFEKFQTFCMSPIPVAGFKERTDEGFIVGVLQFVKSGQLDFEAGTTADVTNPTFWTRTKMKGNQYIIDSDDVMYRRADKNDWKKVGSFYVYILEEVVGIDERQTTNPVVDGGLAQYD